MQIPAQILDAYYQLQQFVNIGWLSTQAVLIAGLLFMGLSTFGQRVLISISKKAKPWPLAAFFFYVSIAVVLKLVQSTIVHLLIVEKSELEATQAPSLIAFLGSNTPEIVVSALLLSAVGLILVLILRKLTSLTWLWLAIAITIVVSATLTARPYFRDTIPLGDSPTEQKVVQLLQRAGIPADRVVLEDCRSPADCPPGQVIGLGPTKLMVFDRRLTTRTPEDQLLQVAAHEAKHFLIDNDLKPVIAVFLICGFIFFVSQMLVRLVRRKVGDQGAVVQLALTVYAFGTVAFLLAQPVVTTWHRNLEIEADRFGLEFNRDNQALIDIMWTDAKQNPMAYRYTPITKFLRATHPQIKDRIKLAETYRPWLDGGPLKYGAYVSD
ncbi:M48 family metalloprotease [Lysobacter sp. A03]|uniref:M48 family metalloprotease n=1 Tax=Lysobacter sp. A03 TaxID=1199154 RepID=UPI0005C70BBC|nr:M48 family metalloprotease [Lysobacter sp. A03]